jgi:hypothetical protein
MRPTTIIQTFSMLMGFLALAATPAAAQPALRVNANAPPGGNGLSWETAFRDLQDALDAADASGGAVTQIWVAAGTYRPDRGTHARSASFELRNGLGLYGGFAGWETELSQRNPAANPTILSGDLLGNDGPNFANRNDNSYHVVSATVTDASAGLDGFMVTGGNAPDLGGANAEGAGLVVVGGSARIVGCRFEFNRAQFGGGVHCDHSDPTFVDCSFNHNAAITSAGGMFNFDQSTPVLIRCTFDGNAAPVQGGALINSLSCDALLINCAFRGNTATAYGGGAVLNNNSNPTFVNCAFSGNASFGAVHGGGAIRNEHANPTLINCTLYGNTTIAAGGGLFDFNVSSPNLVNCVLWGNTDPSGTGEAAQISGSGTPSVNYSCIKGWTGDLGGTGNTGADPRFVHPEGPDNLLGTPDDNLRLDNCASPCINAGSNAALPPDSFDLDADGDLTEPIPVDLVGNPRIDKGVVDMGAYETMDSAFGRADSNCDLAVDAFDIDPFVVALTNQAVWHDLYPCDYYCVNDTNRDGAVNAFDIDPFVLCLTVGCP